jgi:hypothetical protein
MITIENYGDEEIKMGSEEEESTPAPFTQN